MNLERYNDSRLLDGLCYDLVLADWPRGLNRALINSLNNGDPPYTDEEVEENGFEININDLTHCRLIHEGRSQVINALTKNGNNFTARTDMPPRHKREEISTKVTNIINKTMRRSQSYLQYYERQRAKAGLLLLHGISPGMWEDEDSWCADPMSIGDMLIPSQTRLAFKNLPLLVARRSFTSIELQRLTQKETRDPGWQQDKVDDLLKWLDSQTTQLRATNWPDLWKPEMVEERKKQDGGFYLGDAMPTVDCFDIYGYVDEGGETGWVRRIILDSWGQPQRVGAGGYSMSRRKDHAFSKKKSFLKDDFIYTSGSRRVAASWQNIACWQFADLSGVFPAYYQAVRSLGWMIYASCHVGMRMRCKFWESVFETLNMLFEVDSMQDAQNALKLNLINRGFIDKTIRPVEAGKRWQVNTGLVELGRQDVDRVIGDNSSSFVQNQNYSQNRTEKTKFQVQAELQAVTQLASAGLAQAYQYEVFEDREIFRRFLKKDSKNADVIKARAQMLKEGVNPRYLVPEAWDVEHERVMGGGNKTIELQMVQWLMENREKYDPSAQRTILRDSTLAITDNPDKANELVPEEPVVSSSIHDAQLAASTMLLALPMAFKDGVNHQEYAAALIGALNSEVQRILQFKNGTPDEDTLAGMQNLAGQTIQGQPIPGNGARAHIAVLEQDNNAKQVAKQLNDALARALREMKAFAQRMQEQAQKQAQAAQAGNGGMDAKEMSKLQSQKAQDDLKQQNMRQSHAQRTVERQMQFEQEMRQKEEQHQAELRQMEQEHQLEIRRGMREHAANLAKTDLEGAANISRNRLSSMEE